MKSILKALNLTKYYNKLLELSYNPIYFKSGLRTTTIFSGISLFIFYHINKNTDYSIAEKVLETYNPSPYILNQFLCYDMNGKINNQLTKIEDISENNKNTFENKLFLTKGEFDFTKEIHVYKNYNGEDGYYVFSPFYVYEDDSDYSYYDDPEHKHQDTVKGIPIIVNRGW